MVRKKLRGELAPMLCLAIGLLAVDSSGQSLRFDPKTFEARSATVNGLQVHYRASEGNVYVRFPVAREYQTLNVYAPEAYFLGQSVNGYTSKTAPIFFPNSVGGYMPGAAAKPGSGMDRMHNTLLSALAHGYVVAAPGARGRTLKDARGLFNGKAPAAIVDLKAAVRYLKSNRSQLPGNVDRIVSNGTSAGGALSALLGASGNNPDYAPFLKALGAAEGSDDVWAVSAYCPITNLDHADAAYEWLLNGVNSSKPFGPQGMMRPPLGGAPGAPMGPMGGSPIGQPPSEKKALTPAQIELSLALKRSFPNYVNGLKLKGANGTALTLDKDGNGPFKEYLRSQLIASAKIAQGKGVDVSKTSWVVVRDGRVSNIDWDGFVKSVGRMKLPPAFDGVDLGTGENNEFGDESVDSKHFTAFGMIHNTVEGARMADPMLVRMMNPMNYLGKRGTNTAKLWRIRHGAIDRDTSLAIPAILATKLRNLGFQVDFAIPWNTPHSGDYDLDELFAWIDKNAR